MSAFNSPTRDVALADIGKFASALQERCGEEKKKEEEIFNQLETKYKMNQLLAKQQQ